MAQIKHRANLSGKSFPLLADNQAQTVIIPQSDSNYSRYGTPTERIRDVGTPEAMYMHNVVPTVEGYSAVGIERYQDNSAFQALGKIILKATPAIDTGISKYILETKDGAFYQMDGALSIDASGALPGNTLGFTTTGLNVATYATINGSTYVYMYDGNIPVGKFGIYSGGTITNIVPAGLNLTNTKGICASNGYIIAWTNTAIAWSAETTPTDFVPSTITGAGGGAIQEANGFIQFCVPTNFGFIIYCQNNCVSATYTGNSRFPFNFREIKGAGGGLNLRLVAEGSTFNYQYAFTTKGLQQLYSNYAETVHAEVIDWIKSHAVQYFDTVTLSFTKNDISLGGSANVPRNIGRLKYIANRYLIYSYLPTTQGTTPTYTYALLYDLELERWGLLKANHIEALEFNLPQSGSGSDGEVILGGDVPIVFLASNGAITACSFDRSADAVLILGKYQYVRNRRLCLDEVTVDLMYTNPSAYYGLASPAPISGNLYAIPILDGQVYGTAVQGTLVSSNLTTKSKRYNFLLDAESFLLVITGSFALNTVAITAHLGGKF